MNVSKRCAKNCNFTLKFSDNLSLTNIVHSSSQIKVYLIGGLLRSSGWSLKGRIYFTVSMLLNDQNHFPIVSIQFLLLFLFILCILHNRVIYIVLFWKMVASGSTETIDRSILWKKAREKKDGTFDEVAIPVIEKIVSRHFQIVISFIYNSLFMITNL